VPTDERPTSSNDSPDKSYLIDGQQRYRVEGRLGAGAFGAVFKCFHEQTSSWVAIKRLQIDEGEASRLVQEATLLGRVESDFVAKPRSCFYDHANSLLYIVSDLATEGDLGRYLREQPGALPLGEAVRLARGIANGIAAIHAERILHRDIKPANVLLYRRDNEIFPRLGDFGLARTAATLSVAEFASPGYSAPEHLAFEGTGMESDLFSFGMVLFELLTGSRASEAADLTEYAAWLRALRDTPIEKPSRRRPAIAGYPELDELTLQLLDWDRTRRRRLTAHDVVSTLRSVATRIGGDTQREAPVGSGRVRRLLIRTAAVASFVAALVGAQWFGAKLGSRTGTPSPPANAGSPAQSPGTAVSAVSRTDDRPPPSRPRADSTVPGASTNVPTQSAVSASPTASPAASGPGVSTEPAAPVASVPMAASASGVAPPPLPIAPLSQPASGSGQSTVGTIAAPPNQTPGDGGGTDRRAPAVPDRGAIISMDGRPGVTDGFAGAWAGHLDDPNSRPSRIRIGVNLRVPADRAMNGAVDVDDGRCRGTWTAVESTGREVWFDQRLQGAACQAATRVRASLIAEELRLTMLSQEGRLLWSGTLTRGGDAATTAARTSTLPPWALGVFRGENCLLPQRRCVLTIKGVTDITFERWTVAAEVGLRNPGVRTYKCQWELAYQRLSCQLDDPRPIAFDVGESATGLLLTSLDRTTRLALTRGTR
jgi:serine/threonine protein kinase